MTEQAQRSQIQQRLQQFQVENASYAQGMRYLLVFLGGLLIGWFVFGWWLVPIRYTQVYPNELHADARSDYFRMVAESYAATQDIGMAAQRLKYWSPEELGPMLYAEATSLEAVNPAVADRLRQIATLLRLSPEGVVAESPGGNASAFKEGAASILGLPIVRIGALLLFLLVLLFLLTRHFKLTQRLRGQKRESAVEREDVGLEDMVDLEDREQAPVIAEPHPPAPSLEPEPAWEDFEDGAEEAVGDEEEEPDSGVLTPPIFSEITKHEEEQPLQAPQEPLTEEPPLFKSEEEEKVWEEEQGEGEVEVAPEASSVPPIVTPSEPTPDTSPLQLGENAERFIFDGDPYYNQIFAIEKEGEYLGEFGMGVGETHADNPQHVLTIEVWLFEKRDIRTVTAALMPPQIYRDEMLRQELLQGDVIPIALEQGETIHLETEGLEVVGRVRRVEFSPSLEDRPIVRYLEVELAGREKDGGSSVTKPSW